MRLPIAIVLLALTAPSAVLAEPPAPATQPSLLRQLDGEVRQAYCNASDGIVRVHVPANLINPAADVIRKWELRRNPEQRTRHDDAAAPTQVAPPADPSAATRPTVPPGENAPSGSQAAHVVTVGLVLDAAGTLFVPLYLDPARVTGPLTITTKTGGSHEATVVAADKQAGITLLRAAGALGTPLKLSAERPTEGALLIAIQGDESRMMVWTGATRESAILIMPGGEVAVLRGGRFLGGPGYATLIAQLLTDGSAHRATLGLRVAELPPEEQGRLATFDAIDRPGLFVALVLPDSPAARAGVRPGDLLLSIGAHVVPDLATVAAVLAEARGHTNLTLGRDGQRVRVDVDLGEPQPAK
jgi:hypothetical protein